MYLYGFWRKETKNVFWRELVSVFFYQFICLFAPKFYTKFRFKWNEPLRTRHFHEKCFSHQIFTQL